MVQYVSGFQTLQLVVCAGCVTSGTNRFAAVITGRTWITVSSDDSHVCSRPLFLRCIKIVVVSFIIFLAWKRSDSATCKYVWDWITLMYIHDRVPLKLSILLRWLYGFRTGFSSFVSSSNLALITGSICFVLSRIQSEQASLTLFLTVLFSWIVLVYTRHLSLNVTVLRRIGFLFLTAT